MTAALTKTRTTTATVNLGINGRVASDTEWVSQHGHLVYRALNAYWVRELDGRLSRHTTLDDARADVAWLIERGR